MAPTQNERSIAISTPLGDDVLLFQQMVSTEDMGRLFKVELHLLSENEQIKLEDVLGKDMTVRYELDNGKKRQKRYFNGYVSQFCQVGRVGNFASYHAILRPWFWYLTKTSDCRIFQNMTVPDIIKEVFREYGFATFDEALSGSYRKWDYCVQYRETDFNFISRLMEQEGIYYYFEHQDAKHTLKFSDSYGSHDLIPDYEKVPYFPPSENVVRDCEYISDWNISQEVQPGSYVLDDFDFERPKANLQVKLANPRQHALAEAEIYDYPGEYIKVDDGDAYARARFEELHTQFELVQGMSNAGGLTVGGLFELSDYPREDQNREYLITSATYELRSNAYESRSPEQSETSFNCSFTAIDSQQAYRPQRVTPKPTVHGPQTAVVVGKAGEEIWTDKYGRVKVQFHWDRYGKSDENSSCWIRVAQVWTGKRWGTIHIPRIGQEVVVEFLEGDPDHPIITGQVYNGDNLPPFALPANQTQSGIKSHSSKGGAADNCNEIRFEDKKGSEYLHIHAEKDQQIEVENDETHWVGRDRSKTIDNDETVHVKRNRTESVGKNEVISISENRTEDVGKNETISIGENRTEDVGKNETISIGKDQQEDVRNNRTITIGKDDVLDVGKKLLVNVGDQIVIKTGDASITMKKNGAITIQGKDITLKGSGAINVKASKNVVIKGSKVLEN